jgi:hypothetical protein
MGIFAGHNNAMDPNSSTPFKDISYIAWVAPRIVSCVVTKLAHIDIWGLPTSMYMGALHQTIGGTTQRTK